MLRDFYASLMPIKTMSIDMRQWGWRLFILDYQRFNHFASAKNIVGIMLKLLIFSMVLSLSKEEVVSSDKDSGACLRT